ncbi:uncharacterized protein EV154DRAFT_503543 [Mucor mucedo]|uniref:uncharacterized protein n=1 Tax=Mucor mucedo TaxID=29922 RepID=UPI00221FAD34|nr:uncharacterized protein EV154DRAFT_503543 [Mucor mucedo]KAI7892983.1 hypothetical protein EV154DRAFT_503543 [Mucor mucedo]
MPSRVNPLLFIVFAACLNSPICFDLDLSRSPLSIRPIVLLIVNKYVIKRISTLNGFMILNNNSASSASSRDRLYHWSITPICRLGSFTKSDRIMRTCCQFGAVISFRISRSSTQTT